MPAAAGITGGMDGKVREHGRTIQLRAAREAATGRSCRRPAAGIFFWATPLQAEGAPSGRRRPRPTHDPCHRGSVIFCFCFCFCQNIQSLACAVDSGTDRCRALRLRRVQRDSFESVFAVNALESHGPLSKWPAGPKHAAQLRALKGPQTTHTPRKCPEPGTLQPRAAVRKLLRISLACGTTAGTLAS